MTSEQLVENKILMRKLVRVFETGNLSEVPALIDAEYIDHQGLDGTTLTGGDGFRSVVTAARQAFLDLRVSIEDLLAEDDRVVARLRWHGTRPGGGPIERETLDIVRFANGRAIEHWDSSLSTLETRDGGSPPTVAERSAAHRLRGVLLKESLADDSPLDRVQVMSTNLLRIDNIVPPQPRWWTEVFFEADADGADLILQRFSEQLRPSWYIHCWTDSHTFVAFAGKVFKYARGDQAARDKVIEYGLSVGVPRHQLDWEESVE